jgi:beta-glucosidase/6-phospho-beta-glucosidase/beta-galactosidase
MQRSLRSFFLAGFECSSHIRPDGVRLDLLASTEHERLAERDYSQVHRLGLQTARDGVRWHLIEREPHQYDWSSWLPMLRATKKHRMQVIWDLCHYGWPDHLDIWSGEFVEHFARFARAATELVCEETGESALFCPVNEISYWAWAGGDVGRINPGATGRGAELKRQLVRTVIAAVKAIRSVDPSARILLAEPLINVVGNPDIPGHVEGAATYCESQFEAHDMIAGRLAPELGGHPDYLDLIGANFYPHNQWYHGGDTIPLGHHSYRCLSKMLADLHARYGKPLLISETGAEGGGRPYWLHHVSAEVMHAMQEGVPIEGICLYPVLDYHGWDNDRVCRVGLLTLPDENNTRAHCSPLLDELRRQQALAERVLGGGGRERERERRVG